MNITSGGRQRSSTWRSSSTLLEYGCSVKCFRITATNKSKSKSKSKSNQNQKSKSKLLTNKKTVSLVARYHNNDESHADKVIAWATRQSFFFFKSFNFRFDPIKITFGIAIRSLWHLFYR